MPQNSWDIKDLLSINENVIYQCGLMDDSADAPEDLTITVYITNHRIIEIIEGFGVCTMLLKNCNNCGLYEGYSDRHISSFGTGEYGVYFGDSDSSYAVLWFYSQEVCMNFYKELIRAMLDE